MNKIIFLALVFFLAYLGCDTRSPVDYENPPILELSSKDSVITYPFPPDTDAQGNVTTTDYVDIEGRLMNADRGSVSDSANIHFFARTGRITGVAATNSDGVAIVHYYPTEKPDAYFDSIWAFFAYNGGTDTAWADMRLKILPDKGGVTDEVGSVTLSASPSAIQVSGTGGMEQSTVTALVRDTRDNLISDGTPVIFQIVSGPAGAMLRKDTGYTESGEAKVILSSGTKTGIVEIQAAAGAITIKKSVVSINSGPPASIAILPVYENVSKENTGTLWKMYLHALLKDANHNTVDDGWVVNFDFDSSYTYQTIQTWPVPDTATHTTDLSGLVIEGSSETGRRYAVDGNGDPLTSLPGIAETFIQYPTANIFDSVMVIAWTTVDSVRVQTSKAIGLLLPAEGITMTAELRSGSNIEVDNWGQRDTGVIVLRLKDGTIGIPGARIRIQTPIGTLLPTARTDSTGSVSITDHEGAAEFTLMVDSDDRPIADEREFTKDILFFTMDQPDLTEHIWTITVLFSYEEPQ